MKTNCTPAPWPITHHFEAPNTYSPFILIGPAQVRFLQGYSIKEDAERKKRALADAQLISSAPQLLQALQGLLSVAEKMPQPATHDGLTLAGLCAAARGAIYNATREG